MPPSYSGDYVCLVSRKFEFDSQRWLVGVGDGKDDGKEDSDDDFSEYRITWLFRLLWEQKTLSSNLSTPTYES